MYCNYIWLQNTNDLLSNSHKWLTIKFTQKTSYKNSKVICQSKLPHPLWGNSHKRLHTKIPKLFVNQSFHIPFGAIHTKDFIQKFQSYLSIKASTSPLGQPTGHLVFWILMHWQCRIGSFACKHHSNFFLAMCAQKQTLYLLTPLNLKHLHSAGSNFPPHPGMVQIPHPQGTGLKHSHAHW